MPATYHGMFEMVQLFMEHGARINGTNALFMAVDDGRVDMLRFLVNKKGVDINMIQQGEWLEELSPGPVLHLAVQTRNSKMVRILVKELGADPLVKDQSGKTAVEWARCIGDTGILKVLDPTHRDKARLSSRLV